MNKQARLAVLLDVIADSGEVTIEQIQDKLDVSAATARRDLDFLAANQLITRTRGGAMVAAATGGAPTRALGQSTTQHEAAKKAIAKEVSRRITPGGVIGFTGGTTASAAAFAVGVATASRPEFAADPLTVVTNAVNIAHDLTVRTNIRLVVVGGVARQRSYELIGPLAEILLAHISIDTMFLGVNAIDPHRGFFTHHDGEAAINRLLVQSARHAVVIADHSKFTAHAFAHICDLGDVDEIITDEHPDAHVLSASEWPTITRVTGEDTSSR